jgi:quercetin dioxygenase-like cupin family protein
MDLKQMNKAIIGALAFSVGVAAIATEATQKSSGDRVLVSRSGSQPGSADFFTGSVRIDAQFTRDDPSRVTGATVTFEPAARTAWHSHPLGQTLIVTAGQGRVRQWGEAIQDIKQGDVVWIPANVKHWHGAAHRAHDTHRDPGAPGWQERHMDGASH